MNVFHSKQYTKSLKKVLESGKIKITEIDTVVDSSIISRKKLPVKYKDHPLKGEYSGYRECHIRPDILLIYKIDQQAILLVLIDIGSHSYLFS